MVLIVEGWRECTRISYTDSSAAYRCNHILGPILRFFWHQICSQITICTLSHPPWAIGLRVYTVQDCYSCSVSSTRYMILYCTNTHLLDVHMIHTLHSSQWPGIIHWSHWYEMVLIHLDTKKSGSTTSKANSVPEMSDLSSQEKAIGKGLDTLWQFGCEWWSHHQLRGPWLSRSGAWAKMRYPCAIAALKHFLRAGKLVSWNSIWDIKDSCKHELYHPCWKLYVSQLSSWCKMWILQ